MSPTPTQSKRQFDLITPLGKDKLVFKSMNGTETLSQLYEFQILAYSTDENINLDDLLGKICALKMELTRGGDRYFSGYATAFSFAGYHSGHPEYRITLRPWAWFLTRTSDCKVFQDKSVYDIVREVCAEYGFTDIIDGTVKGRITEKPLEYCLQYRETDWNFIARLLEREGVFIYWRHEAGKHTMILGDSNASYDRASVPGYGTIPYYKPDESDKRRDEDHIFHWHPTKSVQPGKYAHTDYDFEVPKKDLMTKLEKPKPHAQNSYEIYDYPGEYTEVSDGQAYVRERLAETQTPYAIVQGVATARGMAPGNTFLLKKHLRTAENKGYAIISAEYHIVSDEYRSAGQTDSAGDDFLCRFRVMPKDDEAFVPPRITPRPIVQGPQTAVVVGPSGEEIYTDKYGRIKVQFHWDRLGTKDENSSCFIRVAQIWAGKKWGAQFLPRIGQEVVVSFLEGNPDRPLVTGSVYNGDNMPPYELPGCKTQSGIKSRSSKGGSADNYNEIRFEDKKGEEDFIIHAEKDHHKTVENFENHHVYGSRNKTIGHDETIDIGNDREEKIGNSNTIEVGTSRSSDIGLDDKVKAGTEIVLDAGVKVHVKAGAQILLEAAGSSINIGPGGIAMSGVMIRENS